MSLDLSGLTHQRGRQGGVPEVANSEFLERPGQSAASARKPQRPAASACRVSARPRTSAYTNTERNGVRGMRGTSRKDGTSAYWVQAGHGLERARRRDPGCVSCYHPSLTENSDLEFVTHGTPGAGAGHSARNTLSRPSEHPRAYLYPRFIGGKGKR